jgi:hypothetical protein
MIACAVTLHIARTTSRRSCSTAHTTTAMLTTGTTPTITSTRKQLRRREKGQGEDAIEICHRATWCARFSGRLYGLRFV